LIFELAIYLVKFQCFNETIENRTSVTTHFEKLTTGKKTCLMSQLLSKVTVTSCSFYVKCSMCSSCCWAAHS